MTVSPTAALLLHPAFAGLSQGDRQALEEQVTLLRFRPGQQLSDGSVLPSQVLVIVQGQARLLVADQGRPATLAKLGPDAIVGLVSLLRASPCETVTASSELVAAALPDQFILDLHGRSDSFREWCAATLWPAELHDLLVRLGKRTARSDGSLIEAYQKCQGQARLVDPAERKSLADGDVQLYLASANVETGEIGDPLDSLQSLPCPRGPFPLRLIALPRPPVGSSNGADPRLAAADAAAYSPALVLEEGPAAPVPTARDVGQGDPRRDLQLVRGDGSLEETLACFQMLSKLLVLPFRRDAIEKSIREQIGRGLKPNLNTCGYLAVGLGLHAMGVKLPASACTRLNTPALIAWKQGFALVITSNSAGLTLASPRDGWVQLSPQAVADAFPEGLELLLLERSVTTPEQRFNFSWFLPALKRHRGVLIQVLVASFVVQLFSLANPLLIQVIIDKVISQRSLDTLQVLGIALVAVTLMEGVIGSLRTFLFVETTNRIDLRLGAEVIDHLLRLPLNYFDRRPVGELGTRIAELEKIRNFLTGQALTTVLDAAFSVIYIAVMAIYSWLLTLVALFVVPIQVALTVLGAPLFRRQYRQAAEENARSQSHLVEVLTGIQTVKAQNVEMVSRWKWQDLYARYIGRTFEQTITGTAITQASSVLQKLSQLLVLWVGASLVLDGQLTLGQLIAFRIISGYVTQPLMRLSSIWQNIQELKVSFERLADVVDTPQESNPADQSKIPLPAIQGHVRFVDVQFSFQKGQPPVLKGIDLDVPQGTFVGIVGQSGSGKSTLMKLLPRLYSPDRGKVLIDDFDIDKVELYSLRRQIGIVPQDPLLFSGSVSDNIALTDPEATSDSIIRAATLACAHDFVMELPSGYSTPVGERGASLSGGQRQRLAIARTLLSNPKLLVMDEATSALDYDTERRLCNNLRENLSHCTVFFITHRLPTIRHADMIVMMHQGAIVETGSHDELMALQGRYYALYRQQEAGS